VRYGTQLCLFARRVAGEKDRRYASPHNFITERLEGLVASGEGGSADGQEILRASVTSGYVDALVGTFGSASPVLVCFVIPCLAQRKSPANGRGISATCPGNSVQPRILLFLRFAIPPIINSPASIIA
jgi:hypothetical protein